MSKLDFTAAETQNTGKILLVLKAVILSMVATFIALSLLAVFITYGPVGENAVSSCVTAAVIISIFTASLTVSNKSRSKGWLSGIITAAIYLFVMILIGAIAFGGFSFGAEALKLAGMSAVSGCIGGIVGVNIKYKKKRKK